VGDQATLQQAFDTALAELKGKQRGFVVEYLRDLHGQNAAIRAGYSKETARSQASRMLTNVNIRAAVDAGIALYAMPEAEVLFRISGHARGDMSDFLTITEEEVIIEQRINGVEVTTETARRPVARLDLEKAAAEGKLHLIKSYSKTDKGERVELYDAQAAQRDLAKIHGLAKDDGGILKYLDLSKLSKDQLQRLADGDDPIAVLLSTSTDPGTGGAGAP
jgi:phage terminase small subunit